MYLQNDMFLQISNSEGNSYATLDALLCGMVIIATPVGLFGNDVPEDCFVRIEVDKIYDTQYIDEKIKYAWDNRFELSKKIREWYLCNCSFANWKQKMLQIISIHG